MGVRRLGSISVEGRGFLAATMGPVEEAWSCAGLAGINVVCVWGGAWQCLWEGALPSLNWQ